MVEEKVEAKVAKKEKEVKTVVVTQLPTQQVTKALDESGNEYNLVTVDEALTEMLETLRYIKKGI